MKKIAGYLLPVILTVIFLYFAFRNINFSDIWFYIHNSSVPFLLLFLLLFILSIIIRAYRWLFIADSVKKGLSYTYSFGAVVIGYGINCVVPRLGELYRAFFVGKWENISRSSVLGTVIVERIIDIIALAFSVLISVLIFPGNLYEKVEWLQTTLQIVFLLMLGVVAFLFLLVKYKESFSNAIVNFIGFFTKKYAERAAEIFSTLTDGLGALRGRKNYFMTFVLTVIMYLTYGLNSYVALYMMGMDQVQDITLGMGWIVMTIAAFGIVIPTPGGTGSYHLIATFVLTSIYGFSKEISLAYAFLTHFISYTVFILLMFIIYYYINARREKLGFTSENFFSVFKKSTGQ